MTGGGAEEKYNTLATGRMIDAVTWLEPALFTLMLLSLPGNTAA